MFNKKYEKSYKEVLAVPVGRQGVLLCLNKPNGFNDRDETKCFNFALVANQFLETQDYWQRTCEASRLAGEACDLCKESVVCIDYDGKVLFANKELCEVLGKEKDLVVSQAATEVFGQSAELLARILDIRTKKDLELPEIVLAGKKFRGVIHYLESYLMMVIVRK